MRKAIAISAVTLSANSARIHESWTRRSASLQEFEGFIVTFPLEKVSQLGIDWFRQSGSEVVDLF